VGDEYLRRAERQDREFQGFSVQFQVEEGEGRLVIGYWLLVIGEEEEMRGAGERRHPAGPARRLAGRVREETLEMGNWRLGKRKRRAEYPFANR